MGRRGEAEWLAERLLEAFELVPSWLPGGPNDCIICGAERFVGRRVEDRELGHALLNAGVDSVPGSRLEFVRRASGRLDGDRFGGSCFSMPQ